MQVKNFIWMNILVTTNFKEKQFYWLEGEDLLINMYTRQETNIYIKWYLEIFRYYFPAQLVTSLNSKLKVSCLLLQLVRKSVCHRQNTFLNVESQM